jgi:putative oxidoreductase
MTIARTIARILLGALFTLAGIAPLLFGNPPPEAGLAGVFDHAFYQSGWVYFVGAAQLTIGVLLLTNRFVPVALIMLAAFLYNSLAYHILIAPKVVLPLPILIVGLWLLIAWPYRGAFATLFRAKAPTHDRNQTRQNAGSGAFDPRGSSTVS